LKDFIEVLKKIFGFGSIRFLNIFSIDLYDGWKTIDNELFKEGAMRDRIALWLYDNDLKIYKILKFGDLQQTHNITVFEL
jgi:hypothetical protein